MPALTILIVKDHDALELKVYPGNLITYLKIATTFGITSEYQI